MIAITGHLERARVRGLSKRLLRELEQEGLKAEIFDISSGKLNKRAFDLVCVVGGDGSLLRVARELHRAIPLLGIAAGKRSYLMQVKEGQLQGAAERIAAGKYSIVERTRMSGTIGRKRLPNALNEYLVVPRESGSLISCKVRAGRLQKQVACDGLIIATPTGSSGHAYSAGGRKLKQSEKKFIIVPSNPLNRQGKPFTVLDRKRITVECIDKGKGIEVVADGRARHELQGKLLVERGDSALLLHIKGLR
jgi:NAD+ kinase